MIRRNPNISLAVRSLGLAAFLAGLLMAPPAVAAPTFGVDIARDSAAFPTVSHSDERIDYTVNVSNTTASEGGGVLACLGKEPQKDWFPDVPVEYKPTFSFKWLRNGVTIGGATSETYTTTAADEGKAIQCEVVGTNSKATASYVSQPAFVVDPQPATAPPAPSDRTAKESRPWITDASEGFESAEQDPASVKRLCVPPKNWPAGTTYTFQWLRNDVPIPGATSAEYDPAPEAAENEAKPLQCEVIGTNAGGSVKGISDYSRVGTTLTLVPFNEPSQSPEVVSNLASSPITLEIELPGGSETYAFRTEGTGWSCDRIPASGLQHARAICSNAQIVPPGNSYAPLTVVTALGADAPDIAVAKATVFGGGASAPISDEESTPLEPAIPFDLKAFEAKALDAAEHDYTQAGGHPFSAMANLKVTMKRRLVPNNKVETASFAPIEHVKQVITEIPHGFVGNPLAIPQLCPAVDDVVSNTCPPGSVVGRINLVFGDGTGKFGCCAGARFPIFAIEPEAGLPAQFAFQDGSNLYSLAAHLRPGKDGYAITIESAPAAVVDLLEATAVLCDFGAKVSGPVFEGCRAPSEAGANPKPLFANPTRCGQPAPVTKLRVNSWEHPKQFVGKDFTNAEITGCDQVPFEPAIDLQPTSHRADSPTGIDVELSMPTDGLEDPEGIAQANLKRARVTLPEGMAVNASAGHGLQACSSSQIGIDPSTGIANESPVACPDGSKIGTVEVDTPLLKGTLPGDVYIAKQKDNPFGSLLAIYMVIDSPKDGILVKLAGEVTPDPRTGRLVVTFSDNPEVPFASVRLHFPGGLHATLIAPPKCGTYAIKAELSPWNAQDPNNPTAAETVTQTSSFKVNEGPNGAPCPSGALDPKLSAGTSNPVAGHTSPFVLRLHREDGSDRLTALNLTTPPGLSAYLRGIPYCPDATLAAISGEPGTGQAQIDNPSCPAQSQVGTAIAGAGAGSDPLFVDTGRAYLAGPYKGAPLSLALVTPAVAGPIDLGNVVVRTALYVNPETAQIAAVSDPIPTILHGILLDLRDVRVSIDRPHFTLNPTSCEPLSIGALVKGESGASANLASRFQVGGCDALSFGPKLGVRLFGGTRRGAHPSLKGTLQAAPGEAGIARAAVTIPRSEFLDQAHIRTICTRVQFAAKACPPGSVYGSAIATTPLLDYPVEGPVYLRSSDHKLPDLVVDLHGPAWQPIEAVVVGRVDSIKGQIRTTFEAAPDVPIEKFTLSMQGGKKGLLVNSRDICGKAYRATVKLEGHNGMRSSGRPAVKNGKCGKRRAAKHKRHRRAAAP